MRDELVLPHEECMYCMNAEKCSKWVRERSDDECAEIICSLIEDLRDEYEEAWRIYVSQYED